MEKSPDNSPVEIEEKAELASDGEIVAKLVGHITGPCKVEVDGKICDIENFWISRAKEVLVTLTDEKQKIRLQKYIDIYDK